MPKLKLNLNALAGTSFNVGAAAANGRGTVNGHGLFAAMVICATVQAGCNFTDHAGIHQTCGTI